MLKTFLVFFLISSFVLASQKIEVEDAWVRAVPKVSKMTAAYMKIENEGKEDDELIGAETDICETVEIHTVYFEDDVMKMRKVNSIKIPAGGEVKLKPSGYHLMLIGLKKHPSPGERVKLKLKFKNAGVIEVEAKVRKR